MPVMVDVGQRIGICLVVLEDLLESLLSDEKNLQ